MYKAHPARFLGLIALVAACADDQSILRVNRTPTITLTSHEAGAAVNEGYRVDLAAVAEDADDPVTELSVLWFGDGAAMCGVAALPEDGTAACGWTPAFVGTSEIKVQATDSDGSTGEGLLSLEVVAVPAPSLAIASPSESALILQGSTVHLRGTATHPLDAAADLIGWWTSDAQGTLVPEGPGAVDGDAAVFEGEVSLSVGHHWLTLHSRNTTGKEATADVEVDVRANEAPTATGVELNTLTPVRAGFLKATLLGYADANGDPAGTHVYEWSRQGAADGAYAVIAGATTDELALDAYGRGDRFKVRVYPVDSGDTSGRPVDSAVATIQNTAPSLAGVSFDPRPLPSSSNVTALGTGFSDPDGDGAGTFLYAWAVQRVGATDFTPLAATTSRLVADYRRGERLRVTITPRDVADRAGAPVSDVIEVENGVPRVESVRIDPATPTVEMELSAGLLGFSDPDGDGEGDRHYAWYVRPVGGSYPSTPDSTEATLAYPAFGRGDRVKVVFTAQDYHGAFASPVTSAEVVIGNAPPSLAHAVISPASPTSFEDLTVTLDGWADPDGDRAGTPLYAWYRKPVGAMAYDPTPVATTSTLPQSRTEVGDRIFVEVTPRDEILGEGAPVRAAEVVIVNSPPSIDGVKIGPSHPDSLTNLAATFEGYVDENGDAAGIPDYAWFRKRGSESSFTALGVTTPTLSETHTRRGDQVLVKVTPRDALGALGATVDSSPVTIENAPPTLASVSVDTLVPTRRATLKATASGYADPDGDSDGSHKIAWYREAAAGGGFVKVAGATSAELSLTTFAKGDRFQAEFTPVDVDGAEGVPVVSPVATLQSAAPSISSVALTPNPLRSSDDLTAMPVGYADPDGDIVGGYTYAWSVKRVGVGFAALPSVTGSVLGRSSVLYRHGERVRVEVTPRDLHGVVGATVSAEIEVGNGAPSATGVAVSPVSPVSTDVLAASLVGFDDPDGDFEGDHEYAWYVRHYPSTTWVLEGTDPTLAYPAFTRADRVKVVVIPHDPSDAFGAAVSSAEVQVGNTAPGIASVAITPSPATNAAILGVAITGWSDADGDAQGTHRYAWYRKAVGASSYETTPVSTVATLSPERTNFGDQVYVRVTPVDTADLAGTTVQSSEVTIVNTPPTVASVAISDSAPTTVPNLTAIASGYADGDGHALAGYQFEWYRKRLGESSFTLIQTTSGLSSASTLSTAQTVKHDALYVRVSAQDALGLWGPVSTSAVVTVLNLKPALTQVEIRPPYPMPGEGMAAFPYGYSDTDGDPAGSHRFEWYIRPAGSSDWGTSVFTGPSLPPGMTAALDEVKVVAYGHDNDALVTYEADPVTSPAVTVATWRAPTLGTTSACAIRSDGRLWCWGDNTASILGDGSTLDRWRPVPVAATLRWKAVAANPVFGAAVRDTGEMYVWGANNAATTAAAATPRRFGTDADWQVVRAATSLPTACGIRLIDGVRRLYCWGDATSGLLANGFLTGAYSTPDEVPVYSPDGGGSYVYGTAWQDVSMGNDHVCGITSDGRLYCWGQGQYGRLGLGSTAAGVVAPALRVGTDSDWLAVAAGSQSTCGIRRASAGATSGALWCWGKAQYGVLGNGTTTPDLGSPTRVGTGTDWEAISLGGGAACALRAGGSLYCWGSGANGVVASGATSDVTTPTAVATATRFSSVELGSQSACATTAGQLWCWGAMTGGNLADRDQSSDIPLETALEPSAVLAVSATTSSAYRVSSSTGRIHRSGADSVFWYASPSGLTSYNSIAFAVTASVSPAMRQIASSNDHVCGVTTENRLFCLGNNRWGQLATGGTFNGTATLTQVAGSYTDWESVTVASATWYGGDGHSCGIRSNASGRLAYCWGSAANGRLGNNNATTNQVAPSLVYGGYPDWAKVSAGTTHSCGIRSADGSGAGTLWCWGDGTGGALGRNSTTPSNIPVQVVGTGAEIFTDWRDVSAGWNTTCAVRANGELYCWGDANLGTNGDLSAVRLVPIRLGTSSDWKAVSVGTSHACGIRGTGTMDKTVWCWGRNLSGELGNGLLPLTNSADPTLALAPASNWMFVGVGGSHTCATESDGTTWCWGDDTYGQLGLGYPNPRLTPARSL